MKQFVTYSGIFGLLLSIFNISCNNLSTDGVPSNLGNIKLSIRTTQPGPLNKLSVFTGNPPIITSAQVVIEKIKFKSIFEDSLDFRLKQPFVKDLSSLDTLHVIENITIPFGSYKETEIEIDDLEPEDGQVYLDHPELRELSIRITGYVNGDSSQPFVFTSDLSEEQEREFEPPLILDENSPATNVVLFIDMSRWFVDGNGNPLDPRLSANHELIEDNIEASIDIFEDEDDDGHRDDEDDDDDGDD